MTEPMNKCRMSGGLLIVASLAFFVSSASAAGDLTVTVIDVGQADAILLTSPDDLYILVDGGEPHHCPTSYLQSHNVTYLTAVVLSHPDEDHVGCLGDILLSFSTGQVIHNGQTATSVAYQEFAAAIATRAIPTAIARAGQVYTWGCCITATVLNPATLVTDKNDNSVVLRVNYGSTHALLTGDISTTAENRILGRGPDLYSQLLKVAHHGSSGSSSATFLSAVAPQYAAISVGPNDWGHPRPDTLARLAAVGAAVYRTDQAGTLVFHSDGQTITPPGAITYTVSVFLPIIVSEPAIPAATPTATPTETPAVATPTPTGEPPVFNTPTATATQPVPTATATAGAAALRIIALDYAGNPEYIRIRNNGAAAQNMTNWRIRSVIGEQWYSFPTGYTLGAGSAVDVVSYSNAVDNPPAQLLWSRQAIWNNSGDAAELRNEANTVVSSWCYPTVCP